MTSITSWRPFRSFVRRVGLFDDLCREFVPVPAIVGDPGGSTAGDAGSDDEATSTSSATTSQGAEGIHSRRKS